MFRLRTVLISLLALSLVSVRAFSSGETYSPNMNLVIPGVGVTSGPQWASDLNSSLNIIDTHDHSPGHGVPVTPAGLNISSDLSFLDNNATNLNSCEFTSNGAPLSTGLFPTTVYVVGNELYYNDGSGHAVPITNNGSVAVSGQIGFTGLPSGTAGAAYVSGTGSFVFSQSTGVDANLDIGPIALRYTGSTPSPTGNYFQLLAPSGIGAYNWTVPTAQSGNNGSLLTVNTSGAMSYSLVDNVTLQWSANVLALKLGGITSSYLSPSAGILGSQMASNANFPGLAVKETNQNVVVSSTNATNSLSVIRGQVTALGGISSGEGFSVNHTGTGVYVINFSTAFSDIPACTATILVSSPGFIAQSPNMSGVQINVYNSTPAAANGAFGFICMGQR